MCPDWESSQRPFGSQARAQSTEPHQPVLRFLKVQIFKRLQEYMKAYKRRHVHESHTILINQNPINYIIPLSVSLACLCKRQEARKYTVF